MAETHRRRATGEEKRRRILDAAEGIMRTDGYAAVTSRRVGAAAGIQASLVHYYFSTLDDLFIAILARRADRTVERMAEALASPTPLRAWWDLASDPKGTALLVELLAAANHRPALRAVVGRFAREVRRMQVDALGTLLCEYGIDADLLPPALVAAAIQGLAFGAVQDQVAGYDTGPDEVIAAMGRLLDRLEASRSSDRSRDDQGSRGTRGRLRSAVESSRSTGSL
jgi:AcrR family transcriptional regulator